MASSDIFISYAPKDAEFRTQLSRELTARGFSVLYDQDVANVMLGHRFEIRKRIDECAILLLLLSPEAARFSNVKDQLYHAKGQGKEIVILEWRTAQFSASFPASIISRLATSRRIDFAGQNSTENFDALANILRPLIGGVASSQSLDGAAMIGGTGASLQRADIQIIQGQSKKQGRRSGGLKKKKRKKETIKPIALSALVISNIITPFDLEPEDEEWVKGDIKWLFSAVDNLLNIYYGEIGRDQPVALPIPPDTQTLPEADNHLLRNPEELFFAESYESLLETWGATLEATLRRANTYLLDLEKLLARETAAGEAGKGDIVLQEQIKTQQTEIIQKILLELSKTINQAYGIRLSGPEQLLQLIKDQINPIALGSLVISNVITSLDLVPEDRELVNSEVKWLFSAANNFLQIRVGKVERTIPIIERIPLNATRQNDNIEARNHILNTADLLALSSEPISLGLDTILQFYEDNVRQILKNIKIHLDHLDALLEQESRLGEAGKNDDKLQNNLSGRRKNIIELLQELAKQMSRIYNILLATPEQLLEFLG